MTGEVLECQLLAAPGYSHVPSENCYPAVGVFAKGIFQQILHIQSENVFQQEEVITAKEASGSSVLASLPGPRVGWRGSAAALARVPMHSSWMGPGSSQLLCSSSPTDREEVLKPSTEVHVLEGEKECCSKFVLFIYCFIFTSGFACCPCRWKES